MMQAPGCALWCIVQAHPALHQAIWQQPHRRQLDDLRHLHGAAVATSSTRHHRPMHGNAAVHFQSAIRCTLAILELTLRELLCSWSKYSAVCTSRSCSSVTSTGVTSCAAP